MPTYEYECQACGHKFDHFQSMTSNRLRTCPECKKKKLVRLVGSGAGVIFKGSGFYETDYKRSGSPKSTPDAASGEGSDSKSGSTDSDSAKDASASKSGSEVKKDGTGSKSSGSKGDGSKGNGSKGNGSKGGGGRDL